MATISGVLPQRGYLWQLEWTPAVVRAVADGRRQVQGVILLGAEIEWVGQDAKVVRANIDWNAIRVSAARYSIALRIAPRADLFRSGDRTFQVITEAAKSLLHDGAAHGVALVELQLDFDCGQEKLAAYRNWLRNFRVHNPSHSMRGDGFSRRGWTSRTFIRWCRKRSIRPTSSFDSDRGRPWDGTL